MTTLLLGVVGVILVLLVIGYFVVSALNRHQEESRESVTSKHHENFNTVKGIHQSLTKEPWREGGSAAWGEEEKDALTKLSGFGGGGRSGE